MKQFLRHLTAACRWLWTPIWKAVVLVVGGIVLLAGLVMLFTPGQGVGTILIGLAILATEFPWARRALRWLRRKFAEASEWLGQCFAGLAERQRARRPRGQRAAHIAERLVYWCGRLAEWAKREKA